MSIEQHAFMQKAKVPSRDEWQAAVDRLGFDLQIDPGLRPFEDSGFLPCKLSGRDSGFEIYYEAADELLDQRPALKGKLGGRNFAISFRWGGDWAECACVCIASAALAASFDAVVYYDDDALIYSADDLVREAHAAMKEM
jgi:hypothetical protein